MKDWIESSPERRKLFAQERLISQVAEELYAAMEDGESTSRAELAQHLGKSRAFVSQILSGSRNLTLRTLADIATALGRTPELRFVATQVKSEWVPLNSASLVQLRPQSSINYVCMNDGEEEIEELGIA